MEAERTKCPHCGATLEREAAFCEACGTRVDRACGPSSAVPSSPCGSGRQPAAPQDAPADAAPFEVFAALPEAMQVGRRSLVHLRFRAFADIYESVEFVLRNGDDELARRFCCSGRPFAFLHEASLDVTPRRCGAARVALDVVCRVGAECDEEIHTVSLDVAVDDKRQASFSPVFNISQNQTSDRAGDTKGGDVNVNLGGLRLSVDEDASRYETPARFVPLRASLRKSPVRLTLSGAQGVVQLVSDEVVSFGRNRDNVIPLRFFREDGTVDEESSNGISRFQFKVERSDRDCLVTDGGGGRASTHGTRIDGKDVPSAGSCRIVSGRDVALGVGIRESELKMRLRFVRDGWGRSSGVVVDREDGANVRVCAVWREVPVSDSERVLWNGSRWALASGSVEPRPIAVGASVSIGGKTFEVLPFHKTHIN